jgi:glyoxalase family protein
MTFFEFPGARRGRAGAGQVHTVTWRVASEEALDFWADRLPGEVERGEGWLRTEDPEGLRLGLVAGRPLDNAPLTAAAPDVPAELALQGFAGVHAYANDPSAVDGLLDALGFVATPGATGHWVAAGDERASGLVVEPAPAEPAIEGAGSVHHVAWSLADDAELEAFRGTATAGGARPTPVIDRQYFHSVYFRTPIGVLFELASRDIGFLHDEDAATLGEALKLPPQHERLRPVLEERLTPLRNPRAGSASA